jgi:hypothetical protein
MRLFIKWTNNKWFLTTIFIILYLLMTWILYKDLPVRSEPNVFTIGVDWQLAFRPSSLTILEGKSPYVFPVWNPPWILLLLSPIALLSPNLGSSAMFTLGLFMSTWAAVRIGAKPLIAVAFALSPMVIGNAENGNIDWIVLLGATLPPQLGLFLVLAKPQIGAGIALFWLIESWKIGGWRLVLRTFTPVAFVILISFAFYGFWFLSGFNHIYNNQYNLTAWPYSIPFGFVLLVQAIRSRSVKPAIIATPLLSPIVGGNSWSIALFGILDKQFEFWGVWIFLWVIRLVFRII